MKFTPYTVTLNDGACVLIRAAVPADAPRLLQTITTYVADAEFIPKQPDEMTLTRQRTEEWITDFSGRDNCLLLVAESDGQLLGNIDLTGSPRAAMAHTAMVGMGMLKGWRGKGLGTALINAALSWATENEVLELLWLQVYTQNLAAISLYQRAGFEECGYMKNYFRHADIYYDNMTMSRSVKR